LQEISGSFGQLYLEIFRSDLRSSVIAKVSRDRRKIQIKNQSQNNRQINTNNPRN
jgi:hypothetical protein